MVDPVRKGTGWSRCKALTARALGDLAAPLFEINRARWFYEAPQLQAVEVFRPLAEESG